MSIEEAIYSKTTTHPAIVELMSTRLYPNKLPQNPTLPAATYMRVSTPRVHTHDAEKVRRDKVGLASPRFQFDFYASSYLAAKNLAEVFLNTWEGFKGHVGNVRIDSCLSQNETDFYEDISGYYRRSIDFIIYHQE